jgi:hypothetical protein
MKRTLRFVTVSAAIAASLFVSARTGAQEKRADELFPITTVLYGEIAAPGQLLDVVLKHPLRAQVESLSAYQTAIKNKQYLQLKAIVSVIEAQIGMPWTDAIGTLTAGGIYAAVDGKTQGVALLAKSDNEAALGKMRDTFVRMVREDAQRKGNGDPIKSVDYRGMRADMVDKAILATVGPWLLLTNNSDLGKQLVDHYLDGGDDTLGHNERFEAARRAVQGEPSVWAFVDVAAVRDAGLAKEVFAGQADNPLAELLVGGLLSNLQRTPYATASLYAGLERVRLRLSAPHEAEWIPESRHYYFGAAGEGTAPGLLVPEHGVFSLSTYRDIAAMWLRAADLFNEQVNDELAKADSGLTTLFAGKDFGEEILSAFQPDLQLVVARQDFQGVSPEPAIKLPAVALVFGLRDPAAMQDELRRTFQSLIGFVNVAGAMNGQPQLDLETEKGEGKTFVLTRFVPEADERDSRQARIQFNFSPAVAFVGDRFVVSSSAALARTVAELAPVPDATGPANTLARADLAVLGNILDDNRNQLVAQNMLQEGNSKEEAETQVATILAIARMFRNASLRLATQDRSLTLELDVGLAQGQ